MTAALLVLADLRAGRTGSRGALFVRFFTAGFIVGPPTKELLQKHFTAVPEEKLGCKEVLSRVPFILLRAWDSCNLRAAHWAGYSVPSRPQSATLLLLFQMMNSLTRSRKCQAGDEDRVLGILPRWAADYRDDIVRGISVAGVA